MSCAELLQWNAAVVTSTEKFNSAPCESQKEQQPVLFIEWFVLKVKIQTKPPKSIAQKVEIPGFSPVAVVGVRASGGITRPAAQHNRQTGM